MMAENSEAPTNRFMYDKDQPIKFKTKCHLCIHKFAGAPGCAAYPNGIPHTLASGQVLHEEPYPGDNGIRFEADPAFAKKEEE
jgi:hypothetical protein